MPHPMPRNALEMLAVTATRELQTEREQRKLKVYVQRFKNMETGKQKPKQAEARTKSDEALALLGTVVWKKFLVTKRGGKATAKWFQGEVASVTFTKRSVQKVQCLVEYTDGDSEDMTPQQVRKHLAK